MKILNQKYALEPLTALTPHPRNPNQGDQGALADSLDQNGFFGAIYAQRSSGHILAGHHRFLEARRRKAKTIPVIWLDVDDNTATRILLADNRVTRLGQDDTQILSDLLRDLAATADGLAGTGFDLADLDGLLRDLEQPHRTARTDPDDAPPLQDGPTVTRPGDLWRLGPHRLICADATTPEAYQRLLSPSVPEHGHRAAAGGLEQVDLIWTDPPYNVAYEGKTKRRLTIENDHMGDAAFKDFLTAFYRHALAHTKPGGAIYVAHADTEGINFRAAMGEAGWMLKQCLVWVKQQFVMGRQDYHWRHEPILYGWKPGAAHTWNADRKQDTVLEFDRPTRNLEHPTMKPTALIAYCLGNSSLERALILDPFAGSGSTLIAAHDHDRDARAIELDPRYCDVILRRYQAHADDPPRRVTPDRPEGVAVDVLRQASPA